MKLKNDSYSNDIRKDLLLYLSISDGILKGWGLILSTITLHASFINADYGFINNFISDNQIIYLMRYYIPIFFWTLSIFFVGLYIREIFRKNINTIDLMSLVSPILFMAIFLATGIISGVIISYY